METYTFSARNIYLDDRFYLSTDRGSERRRGNADGRKGKRTSTPNGHDLAGASASGNENENENDLDADHPTGKQTNKH